MIPGINVGFPRILEPHVAILQSLHAQLQAFERTPQAQQRLLQARQLRSLLTHARDHSPFWRDRLATASIDPSVDLDLEVLQRLPPLTRQDIQTHSMAMRARPPGWPDNAVVVHSTSGSTGMPVRVDKLATLGKLLYDAVTLVQHRWHQRDARKTVAVFSRKSRDSDNASWGPPISWFERVGRAVTLQILGHRVEEFHDLIQRHRPAYVVTTPSVVQALCEITRRQQGPPLPVEHFVTSTEQVIPSLRDLARETFGARITDCYSCEEVGFIAHQCPCHDHYHVHAGLLIVEVVDEDGRPCAPGQVGRVLLTSLHSYAMPIIRYEVGDMAIPGAGCDCGIGLPVLSELVGRIRDTILMPDGSRRMLMLDVGKIAPEAGVLEHQVIQYACGTLELLTRGPRPLSAEERKKITERVLMALGPGVPVVFRETQELNWTGLHKRKALQRVDVRYQGPETAIAAAGL